MIIRGRLTTPRGTNFRSCHQRLTISLEHKTTLEQKRTNPIITMISPKYDLRTNPVYQVDFQASAKGKRVSATKKRVVFKFGFSNADAISKGLSGIHCRGEEHQITLVWSLTSGKRLIVADDEEVHYSQGRRGESRFEASWTMQGNHELKLIAHAAPQVFGSSPGFRQFDLLLDGMSFFNMPKIYELGIVSGVDVANRRYATQDPTSPSANYALPREESWGPAVRRYELQHSMSMSQGPSVEEPRSFEQSPVAQRSGSFPSDMVSDPTPVNHLQDHFSAPVALMDQAQGGAVAAPAPTVDEFAPRPPPPPTFETVSNNIMSAYGPPPPATPALPALMNEPANPEAPAYQGAVYEPSPEPQYASPAPYASPAQPVYAPSPVQQPAYAPSPAQPAYAPSPVYAPPHPAQQPVYQAPPPVQTVSEYTAPPEVPTTPTAAPQPKLSMNSPTSVFADLDDEPRDDVERALKSLVNLDDITEKPISPEELKLTMIKKEKEEKNPHKSKPLPPTAPAWHLGSQPSLGEIQAHTTKTAPSKEVMRTHAFDPNAAHSGMMVVYGAPQPPPQQQYIPQAPGFGAGVYHNHHHHGYYGQAAAY